MEYMSQEGFDKIAEELHHLETVELPQVKEQGRLMGRARFLQRILENARVIDKSKLKSDSVGLLSKVRITNVAAGKSMDYTIVSPHEANLREGKISIKSPIAEALLGKKAGDIVDVRVPAGMIKLKIESVEL